MALKIITLLLLLATSSAFLQNVRRGPLANVPSIRRDISRFERERPNLALRGGAVAQELVAKAGELLLANPTNLFNGLLVGLAATAFVWKKSSGGSKDAGEKPAGVRSLQMRFLAVFWLMRMADWLQGPYFYEVYSSKIFNGAPATLDLVSKLFLVGFATTGVFGPWIGQFVDTVGRRAGTLAFAALYAAGALSTRSNMLWALLLGRVAGGLGTSLLFSAPEAWLVAEHQKNKFDGRWLGETFGLAYAGDSLVAITAGQLASLTAGVAGPTGPFTLSVFFLALGAIVALLKWDENVATVAAPALAAAPVASESTSTPNAPAPTPVAAPVPVLSNKPSIRDAVQLMLQDKRILLLGAVQALFEGAMYIFVLQWPPAMKAAIKASAFGEAAVPFGNIFSCFMACCLLGSTAFGALQARNVSVERSTSMMLAVAASAMTAATMGSGLGTLTAAMFLFEACVGMYFPSIGTLRSKYLPDSHRSVIMNLFGLPLNLIVVTVFLSIQSLGVQGALRCAAGALGLATVSMAALARTEPAQKSE
jgi:MFS family permease